MELRKVELRKVDLRKVELRIGGVEVEDRS